MTSLARILLVLILASPAAAQQYVGANPGMINYAEGSFYLNQQPLKYPEARFLQVAEGQVLSTGLGWVEIQLGPTAFLWIGEDGRLQMESLNPKDLHMKLDRGSAIFYVVKPTNKIKITVRVQDALVELKKAGVYRIDSLVPQLSVYEGNAKIRLAGNKAAVKKGMAVALSGSLPISVLDMQKADGLFAKAASRSQILYAGLWRAHASDKRSQPAMTQTFQQGPSWPQQQPPQKSDELERNRSLNRPQGSQEGHPNPWLNEQGEATTPRPQQ